jgi:hypothetical protein
MAYAAGDPGHVAHHNALDTIHAARLYLNAAPGASAGVVTAITAGFIVDYVVGTKITTGALAGEASSGGALTITEAGLYLANIEMNFMGGSTGARTVLLRVNGATLRESGLAATDARPSISTPVVLALNDVVTMAVYTTGTSPTMGGSTGGAPIKKNVGLGLLYLGPAV